jgi:SRSO17 transposase
MPELEEFLEPFRVQFAQIKSAETLRQYLTGQLSEHPTKNCETISEIVPETSGQQFQNLLTEMVLDDTSLNRQRIERMLELGTEGDAALLIDDTGFAKQGKASVGVARQYSGTLGKVTNCQVAVTCIYAERTLAWPVATRLYLPREWIKDQERRLKAHIPKEVTFQTKPEIALGLIDEAVRNAITFECIVSDGDYGDNPNFLNGLEDRHLLYNCAVRCEFSVALGRSAKHEAVGAATLLGLLPASCWETIAWREGSRGQLRAKFCALRCWRVDGDGTRHPGWLIGQRPARSQQGERKYFWSNFPPKTTLTKMAEYAHRRHWIEQYHEEAKGELGWDQYQGRRWDGFHRQALTIMLSFSFLVWYEWRQRQKRRRPGPARGAFSPSAGFTSSFNRGDPSIHRRVVTI